MLPPTKSVWVMSPTTGLCTRDRTAVQSLQRPVPAPSRAPFSGASEVPCPTFSVCATLCHRPALTEARPWWPSPRGDRPSALRSRGLHRPARPSASATPTTPEPRDPWFCGQLGHLLRPPPHLVLALLGVPQCPGVASVPRPLWGADGCSAQEAGPVGADAPGLGLERGGRAWCGHTLSPGLVPFCPLGSCCAFLLRAGLSQMPLLASLVTWPFPQRLPGVLGASCLDEGTTGHGGRGQRRAGHRSASPRPGQAAVLPFAICRPQGTDCTRSVLWPSLCSLIELVILCGAGTAVIETNRTAVQTKQHRTCPFSQSRGLCCVTV